ncbi:hypothetical protein [Nocardia nova]|uniref:hypothetical protein n=1 Tax=Nocardia nova TaxID=37330 RepID=UPI001CA4F824
MCPANSPVRRFTPHAGATRHLPFYGRWFRFLVFWGGCDTGLAAAEVDPPGKEMSRKVWASPHIAHNYYRNDAGEVTGLNPFRLVDYWRWTSAPDPGEYEIG